MRKFIAGFTLIELMITMIIIVILTALSIVVVGNIQTQARDTERKQDIETIARGMEGYYKKGNPYIMQSLQTQGAYPGYLEFEQMSGQCNAFYSFIFTKCEGGSFEVALPGVNASSLSPPGLDSSKRGLLSAGCIDNDETIKCDIPAGQSSMEQNKLNQGYYIYTPLQSRGESAPCVALAGNGSVACASFVLKYKEETSGNIVELTSKNQQ